MASSNEPFNGLGMGLHNISRLSKAKTRSISAENFTGEKGKAGMATEGTGANAARDLGQGWKVSPSIHIAATPDRHAGRNPGSGSDPAYLEYRAPHLVAAADPAHLLGWRRHAFH